MRDKIVRVSIVSIFVLLYSMTSIVSTIHVIDFFKLSNPEWLAVTLAVAFEVGAAACLGAIVILDKTNRWLVWSLFILITVMQMMGNMYYSYSHIDNYQGWSELFGLSEEDPIYQKRILSLISGAILPLVSLGFIKALVDYIRPKKEEEISTDSDESDTKEEKEEKIEEIIESPKDEKKIQIEKKEQTNKSEQSPNRLKDMIYYDMDPTKIK